MPDEDPTQPIETIPHQMGRQRTASGRMVALDERRRRADGFRVTLDWRHLAAVLGALGLGGGSVSALAPWESKDEANKAHVAIIDRLEKVEKETPAKVVEAMGEAFELKRRRR